MVAALTFFLFSNLETNDSRKGLGERKVVSPTSTAGNIKTKVPLAFPQPEIYIT